MALIQVPFPKFRNLANFVLIQVTQCHLYKCHCPLAQVQAIGTHPSNISDCILILTGSASLKLVGEYLCAGHCTRWQLYGSLYGSILIDMLTA